MGFYWAMSASGDALNERIEQLLIDRLRLVFSSSAIRCDSAQMLTRWHGRVDLLDRTGLSIDETEAS